MADDEMAHRRELAVAATSGLVLALAHPGTAATPFRFPTSRTAHQNNPSEPKQMPQSKEERNQQLNSFGWGVQPMMHTPMLAIFAEMNGTLLESVATAQKDWADFVDRRIKEDVAVSRQLMQCHSLADMHQVYSRYLATAFEQYKEQSTKVVQRGQAIAEHVAEATENGKEATRARH